MPWLICTRSVTSLYACRDSFTFMTQPYCATYVLVHVTRRINARAAIYLYACRDQFIRVPWLIHIYDSCISCNIGLDTRNTTHSYACRDAIIRVQFIRMPQLVHTHAVTHVYACCNSFIHMTNPYRATYILINVTRPIRTREVTHSHVWLIHTHVMTQSYIWLIHIVQHMSWYVWRDSFIRVPWLIHTHSVASLYACCDSFTFMTQPYRATYFLCFGTCDATHSCACCASFICVLWFIQIWSLIHIVQHVSWYAWRDSSTRVLRLVHIYDSSTSCNIRHSHSHIYDSSISCNIHHVYMWCTSWLICCVHMWY